MAPQNKLADLKARLERLELEATHLRDDYEAEVARRLMPEPGGEGSIVEFSGRHRGNYVVYNYAALKVGGRWFRTGSTCPPRGETWTQLLDFHNNLVDPSGIEVVRNVDVPF